VTKRDGKLEATLFTPHPALGFDGARVDEARRAFVFPSFLIEIRELLKRR
jgi:hypothetical protein